MRAALRRRRCNDSKDDFTAWRTSLLKVLARFDVIVRIASKDGFEERFERGGSQDLFQLLEDTRGFDMQLSLKTLAAAVALTLGSASAMAQITVPPQPAPGPIPDPNTVLNGDGNGGLNVAIFDPVRGVSIVQYLGLNFQDFLPGAASAAGITLDFGIIGGAEFANVFGASDPANIQWNVSAGDLPGTGTFTGRQLMTTMALGSDPAIRNNAVTTGINNLYQVIFNQMAPATSDCAGGNPCIALSPSEGDYVGAGQWGTSYGTNGVIAASGTIGTALGFYLLSPSSNSALGLATDTMYAANGTPAQWFLSADGHLTYSTVPLPAALWLLLSGVAGLGVVSRRKRS